MILFRNEPSTKLNQIFFWVSQFLREKRHKKWSQEHKQKQSLLFSFCNIFDLLISRTAKIAWWPPVFKSDFYIFSYNEQLRKIWRNFMGKSLLYHTSLSVKSSFLMEACTLNNLLHYYKKTMSPRKSDEDVMIMFCKS